MLPNHAKEACFIKSDRDVSRTHVLSCASMNEKIFDEVERMRCYEPDLYVRFDERAAIMQFDGGLTREEAEREALHLARQKKASERTLRREA